MRLPASHLETRVGSSLGRYTLNALLGVGGSAAVYSATHRNGHKCALKIVHATYQLAEAELARFRQEPYLANKIGHPGVVRIYDDGVDDMGMPYFVMELLEGECLGEWLTATKRPSISMVHRALLGTLEVLEKAHEVGVLHRDVKPSNLFLCKDGSLKVLDFGIARSGNLSTLTATGTVLGTPAFMPPEQALGQKERYAPSTDVFAVGATGLVLLHGGALRQGNELALAALMPLPKPAELGLDGPRAFLQVLEKAVSFDMSARYESAASMRAALVACAKEVAAWDGVETRAVYADDKRTVRAEMVHVEGQPTEILVLAKRIDDAVTIVQPRPPERREPSEPPGGGRTSLDPSPMSVPSTLTRAEPEPLSEAPMSDGSIAVLRSGARGRGASPWLALVVGTVILALGAGLFAARWSESHADPKVMPSPPGK